jgi:hypothetical protein
MHRSRSNKSAERQTRVVYIQMQFVTVPGHFVPLGILLGAAVAW